MFWASFLDQLVSSLSPPEGPQSVNCPVLSLSCLIVHREMEESDESHLDYEENHSAVEVCCSDMYIVVI